MENQQMKQFQHDMNFLKEIIAALIFLYNQL